MPRIPFPERSRFVAEQRRQQKNEHERSKRQGRWLGEDAIALDNRMRRGDKSVTRNQVMEATFQAYKRLADREVIGQLTYEEALQFQQDNARRLLANFDTLKPESKEYLTGVIPWEGREEERYEAVLDSITNPDRSAYSVPPEIVFDMLRLRIEDMKAHIEVCERQVEQYKQEFLEELPGVIEHFNLPIDLDVARQRVEEVNFDIIDPFIANSNGEYDINKNRFGIDYELFGMGADGVKKVVTHELYHVISGRSTSMVRGKFAEPKIGLGLPSTGPVARLRWLNEAVTQSLTEQHMKHIGRHDPKFDTYQGEIRVYEALVEQTGKAEVLKLILDAYFENVGEPSADGHDQPKLRALLAHLRSELGEGMVLALDRLMQEADKTGEYERAVYFIANPGRADAAALQKEARAELNHDTFIEDLNKYGALALAMLSGQRPMNTRIMARAMSGAMTAEQYVERGGYVPKQMGELIDQILNKSGEPKNVTKLQRETEALRQALMRNSAHTAENFDRFLDLAVLGETAEDNTYKQIAKFLQRHRMGSWTTVPSAVDERLPKLINDTTKFGLNSLRAIFFSS